MGFTGDCARSACATLTWHFRRRREKKNCRSCARSSRGWAANWLSLRSSLDIAGKAFQKSLIYDGFQNFAEARARGKGVLFLTAHFGGWEIGSFVHSLNGNPMNIVVRPLDNPLVDAFVDRYRTLHGNRTFGKQDFARGLLTSMKRGEVVGILMDTNMTPPQGAFVDFFGVPACTATGVARVALHTGAAVLPAFTIWDKELGKYKIRFDPALQLTKTGDDEADAIANTALFTKVIESYARRYPEQWLWVHRRWKTRPAGEPSIY